MKTRVSNRRSRRLTHFTTAIEVCEGRCLLSGDDASLLVTTLIDENDAGLGEGAGDSLREILNAANATTELDVIEFDASLFPGGVQTMELLHGQLSIYGESRLIGPGRDALRIDAGGNSGVLYVSTNSAVQVSGLTLTGGHSNRGGGIWNTALLQLSDMRIHDNYGETGGGIYSERNPLTVTNTLLQENSARYSGGGIHIIGSGASSLRLMNSTVDGNTAQNGGGISASGTGNEILNSTISNNTTTENGGGITTGSEMLILNSTISGNHTWSGGGGLNVGSSTGANVTVINSTIANNTVSHSGGSGIANENEGRDRALTLHNTIVAGNYILAATVQSDPTPADIVGSGIVHPESSNNLIGHAGSSQGLINGDNGNIVGIDGGGIRPLDTIVKPLGNNGGATFTHALATDSIAGDAGSATFLPADSDDLDGDGNTIEAIPFDQRLGAHSRVVGAAVDIGASEAGATDVAALSIEPVSAVEVLEGDSGTTELLFRVTRSHNADDTSIDVDISGFVTNADASISSGTVSFVADGVLSKIVTVTVNGDVDVEADEHFAVTLSHPVNASLSHFNQTWATIQNDDANLLVTTLIDENDADLGEGAGDSLREILNAANATTELDVIEFDASLFPGGVQTIELMHGWLNIRGESRLIGPGRDALRIDAGGNSGVLYVSTDSAVQVSGLTLTGGHSVRGGGIWNTAPLQLSDMRIHDNYGETGGGIYSERNSLTVTNTLLEANSARNSGGGIHIVGSGASNLRLMNSTVDSNTAQYGGGISASGSGNEILNSTISNNTATSGGGGITTGSEMLILNSTISGNHTWSGGGGLNVGSSDGANVTVINSTIVNNTVSHSGGSGIANENEGRDRALTLHNTIVAGNFIVGSDPIPADVRGRGIVHPSSSNNLIGDANSSQGLLDGTKGNIVGVNGLGTRPLDTIVDPLSDNGGATFTHALTIDSFAIDAGDATFVPPDADDFDGDGDTAESIPFDQRGSGFNRVMGSAVDIGAAEIQQLSDTIAPTAMARSLPLVSRQNSVTIEVDLEDPDDGVVSGVATWDLYMAVGNGDWTLFADDVAASQTEMTIPLESNTQYWFRTVATDHAGNVELDDGAPETGTRTYDVAPPASQIDSMTADANGLIFLSMSGTDAGGSNIRSFEIFVSIDGGAYQSAGPTIDIDTGNAADFSYQAIRDNTEHTYRFYVIAVDQAGNRESAPDNPDSSMTLTIEQPVALSAVGIDVQQGATQRSFVRHADVLFNGSTGLMDLISNNQIKVERFALNADSAEVGTGTAVTGFTAAVDGNRIRLDFGSDGLGGQGNAGNGFYRILLDLDLDGEADDAHFEFFRLYGDANGDGRVDRNDRRVREDLTGDGVVNAQDRRLYRVEGRRRERLSNHLFPELDD